MRHLDAVAGGAQHIGVVARLADRQVFLGLIAMRLPEADGMWQRGAMTAHAVAGRMAHAAR